MDRANVKILGNDATTFAACFYNEKKVNIPWHEEFRGTGEV